MMRGDRRLWLLLGLAAGTWSVPARAQHAPPTANPFGRKYPPRIYQTVRLKGPPPVIDGRLSDEAWTEGVWSGNYRQQMPTEGAPPSERTELKILYDDRNIYFAIHAYDDPALIHRYAGPRDQNAGDIVGVCFDSYNDKRGGFEFDLTAAGSKIDLILGNGEFEWDMSWDAVWDGKVAYDSTGWTAEVRVPLSQLRYGPQKDQVWGLHSWRWIDRNQEEDEWQLIPRQNTGRLYQLGELRGLHDLPSPLRPELLPHVVGKTTSGPLVTNGPDASGSLGLDAKLGLSSNFTLDGTANPDFGQVEADPSVVNLTAYETFYEEKRPFFLEGSKILSFEIEDQDQLFYSRRIGHAPSRDPSLEGADVLNAPEATTILSAAKVTGKTPGGISLGLLQSVTQKETARIAGAPGTGSVAVEPFSSYTVGRLRKDWDQGNTSVGGIVTSTHRWISDPGLAFLPTQATTGGLNVTRYFANRAWLVDASGFFSRLNGDPQAILAIQTNAVHYYQRPDATHLGVDSSATSLFGYGGSIRFGRSEQGRLRLNDHFLWYSPGLDLNDLGYLRQADDLSNGLFLGWSEAVPRWIFRQYSLQLSRQDHWDFGGLHTSAQTEAEVTGQFANKWQAQLQLTLENRVDTRMLRGGPALRWHSLTSLFGQVGTDPSARFQVSVHGQYAPARDDDSRSWSVEGESDVRLSHRLALAGAASYEAVLDNLQYAATATTPNGPRWVLGRLDQKTWSLTFRANLSLKPDLTVQYYGSPFISIGRYTAYKRVTDPLASATADRYQLYGAGEMAYDAGANSYAVTEAGGGPSYSFANPDFSFRQFRSNLVVRWDWTPGSALYLVWSQGRTGSVSLWDPSLGSNWDALWRTEADNVFLVKLSYWLSP
jgi:hypothetical protein